MRLFGIVNGQIDRFDRAGWFTTPFDIAWAPAVRRRRPDWRYGTSRGSGPDADRATTRAAGRPDPEFSTAEAS